MRNVSNRSCQPVHTKYTMQLSPSSHKRNYLGAASTQNFYQILSECRVGMSVTHNHIYILKVTERIHVLSKWILWSQRTALAHAASKIPRYSVPGLN